MWLTDFLRNQFLGSPQTSRKQSLIYLFHVVSKFSSLTNETDFNLILDIDTKMFLNFSNSLFTKNKGHLVRKYILQYQVCNNIAGNGNLKPS